MGFELTSANITQAWPKNFVVFQKVIITLRILHHFDAFHNFYTILIAILNSQISQKSNSTTERLKKCHIHKLKHSHPIFPTKIVKKIPKITRNSSQSAN